MRGHTQPLLRSCPSIQVPSPVITGNGLSGSTAASPGAKRMFVNGALLAAMIAQRSVVEPEQIAASPLSSTTMVGFAGAACAAGARPWAR